MALLAQAALLDELMGKNRNAAPGEYTRDYHFTDPEVCKHFLCGFCPHELFVNTRADLGPCEKIHDESLKREYEKSSRFGRLGYEEDFESLLRSLLAEVEKRIRKGEERLKLTQGEDGERPTPISAKMEKIKSLNDRINALVQQAEKLGSEGCVDAAKEALECCEKLKLERSEVEAQLSYSQYHNTDSVKAMEVCEVCGSFLIVGDAQCRVEEHITGKQHVGYARIRETVEEIRKRRHKAKEERVKEREHERLRRTEEINSRRASESSSKKRSSSRRRDRSKNGRERQKADDSRHRTHGESRSKRHHSRSRSRLRHERVRSPYSRTSSRKSPSRHDRSRKSSEHVHSSKKRSSRDEKRRSSRDRNGSDRKSKHEDKKSHRRSETPADRSSKGNHRDERGLKSSPNEKTSKIHSESRKSEKDRRNHSDVKKDERISETHKRSRDNEKSKHSHRHKHDISDEMKESVSSDTDIEVGMVEGKKSRYDDDEKMKDIPSKDNQISSSSEFYYIESGEINDYMRNTDNIEKHDDLYEYSRNFCTKTICEKKYPNENVQSLNNTSETDSLEYINYSSNNDGDQAL